MKILITGATGGLGRNAVDYALARGAQVTALGRNAQALDSLPEQVRKVTLDLVEAEEPVLVSLMAGHDVVWHCAARSSPWGAEAEFYAINVVASVLLYRAAALAGVPAFVHISTPAVYFNYAPRYGVPESGVASAMPNAYAATKLQAEQALTAMAGQFDTRLTILRPRAIFGPHDRTLLPRIMASLRANSTVLVLPKGGATLLDLTYAENVAHAMWLATERPSDEVRIFNITNDEPVFLASALTRLFDRMGRVVAIKSAPASALDWGARCMERVAQRTGVEPRLTRYSVGVLANDMTLSIKKARRELGYQPVVSLDEGLARTAADWVARH